MEDLQKSIYINQLYNTYGNLLSATQKKMIDLYYGLDLSLSEIAEQENISRNAVYDAIKKGIDCLNNYENKLHLVEQRKEFEKKLLLLKNELDEASYKLVVEYFKED